MEGHTMGIFDRYDEFAHLTFKDGADRYLEEFDGKCKDRQEYALDAVMPYIGHLRLFDVDDGALQQYKKDRLAIRMAGTVNKEISTAQVVLNKAYRVWRWIPGSPLLQRVSGDTRKAYPISWPEQDRLFQLLPARILPLCIFAVNTGVRRGELWKLMWSEEQDMDGVKLFIIRGTKNGKDRPVILNSLARRAVESMRGLHGNFVFREQSISKPFNKAWIAADLPDKWLIKKGIHNLRHTCGMRLRNAGVAPEDRDMILGHHNRSLTQHYAAASVKKIFDGLQLITKPNDMAVLR